jgi:pyocin large subunit-like protein
LQQFINQVKQADAGRQKEVRLDIQQAKKLAFTLGEVMSRLEGDLESLIKESQSNNAEVIEISIDGGNNWK